MSDFDHPKMQDAHSCSTEVEVQTKKICNNSVIRVRILDFTYPFHYVFTVRTVNDVFGHFYPIKNVIDSPHGT